MRQAVVLFAVFALSLSPIAGCAGAADGLTADEKDLLTLASRNEYYVNGAEVTGPKWSAERQRAVILKHDHSRGRRTASCVFLRQVLFVTQDGTLAKNAELYSGFPDEMRKLAIKSVGLALSGQDVPPPLTPEFRKFNQSAEDWMDNLRRSEVRLKKIAIEIEKTSAAIASSFEDDLGSAFGRGALPINGFQARSEGVDTAKSAIDTSVGRRSIPRLGQFIELKYVGKEPLTNVVFVGRVKSTGTESGLVGGQKLIDGLNQNQASPGQANDARDFMTASNQWGTMPKAVLIYLPKLAPGDEVNIPIGYMEKGAVAGHSLGVYADQGRITARDLNGFPEKARPLVERMPTTPEPKIGERVSAPSPGDATDKLYVGSVWRGKSTATKPAGEATWELIVTERKGNAFKAEAHQLNSDTRNRRQVYGTIKPDGSLTIPAIASFVKDLPNPGRLADGKITFAPSRQRPKYANSVTLDLDYIPPTP